MDPEAALQETERHIRDEEWSSAVESLTGYYRWRVKGGFEPETGDARAERLSARLADGLDRAFEE